MENKAHRRRLAIYGCLTLAVMAFIYIMSAQNGEDSQNLSDGFLASLLGKVLERILPQLTSAGANNDIRKYAHMFEFFCLGCSSFLFFYEWLQTQSSRFFRAGSLAFINSWLYACTDELHQRFIPGRAGRMTDVWVDSIGVVAGVLLVGGWMWVHRRKTGDRGKAAVPCPDDIQE